MNFVNFATTARLQNDSATSSQNEDFQGLALQTLLNRRFENIQLDLDAPSSTLWCHMTPPGRPSYTHELMQDISEMQELITSSFSRAPRRENTPFSWFVMASAVQGFTILVVISAISLSASARATSIPCAITAMSLSRRSTATPSPSIAR
ncbi:hypothetical protein GT370_19680 [Acidocella sp. MX-AZ03]|uniref:hypothetical protein n=1 Tax=Acidocella sp. MX-AZ03 TaxID=2697363 RepID=UPI0022DDC788|nr:hypothetical protein [Acidocella sp. MX-AZ03]WBO59236.1 hypothetical protein GT370_19680 [Acidocella sp. MX-AZ03]